MTAVDREDNGGQKTVTKRKTIHVILHLSSWEKRWVVIVASCVLMLVVFQLATKGSL